MLIILTNKNPLPEKKKDPKWWLLKQEHKDFGKQ